MKYKSSSFAEITWAAHKFHCQQLHLHVWSNSTFELCDLPHFPTNLLHTLYPIRIRIYIPIPGQYGYRYRAASDRLFSHTIIDMQIKMISRRTPPAALWEYNSRPEFMRPDDDDDDDDERLYFTRAHLNYAAAQPSVLNVFIIIKLDHRIMILQSTLKQWPSDYCMYGEEIFTGGTGILIPQQASVPRLTLKQF